MKFKETYIFFMMFSIYFATAQNFSTTAIQLGKELQEFETIKARITQTVKEIQPGVLKIEIISTTIKDGKSSLESYEFNMADIDINTIKTFTDKDVIQVQLLAAKKQKVIRKTVDSNKT